MLSAVLVSLIVVGVLAGLGLTSQNRAAGWVLFAASLGLGIVTMANVIFGATVSGWHEAMQRQILRRLLAKETFATGIKLHDLKD